MRRSLLLAGCLAALGTAASAQDQSRIAAEFSKEGQAIRDSCFSSFSVGCLATLFTGEPVHVSAGTIAPQNGVGIGGALLWHATSEQWRVTGSVDAVRAFSSGARRAGTYTNFVRTALDDEHSHACERLVPGKDVFPVIGVYVQSTSLAKVAYFGIGPDSRAEDKTFFGFDETIVGAKGVCLMPGSGVLAPLRLSISGEANGRFVKVRSGPTDDVPSIEQVFTEASAPGLTSQPGVAQFAEAVRATPSLAGGNLNLNYLFQYQQFGSSASGASSFQRWAVDLRHEILLYGTSVPTAKDTNDPNRCSLGPTTPVCPSITSRNRTGSLTLRAFVSRSIVSGASAVPFYFQHTLGGSDLDGNRVLASYDDYRFRGPHLLLFQETFEHSLWSRLPVGLWLAADHGMVAGQHESFDLGRLRSTFTVGASLRAGGLPMALLTYSTGGPEGHHVALTVSPTLLGGSSRPSLQ